MADYYRQTVEKEKRERNMSLLTDDQLTQAVELFAQGKNRKQVAAHLIDDSEALQERERTEENFRNTLSDALRSADPTSSQFAITKYGTVYELHKEAMRKALANKYESAVLEYVEYLDAEIENMKNQQEELQTLIDSAQEIDPTGTGEYLSVLSANTATGKRIEELKKERINVLRPAEE